MLFNFPGFLRLSAFAMSLNRKQVITSVSGRSLAVLLLALLLSACQSDEEQANEYLASAKFYFEQGNVDLASVELKNAIRKNSSLSEAYYLQAIILRDQQDWEGMHAFLGSTLQQQPNHVNANLELARLYARAGESARAQTHIDTVKKLSGDTTDTLIIQAQIFANENNLEDARLAIADALSLDANSAEANLLSAKILLREGNEQQALEVIDNSLLSNNDSQALRLFRAKLLTLSSDLPAAAQEIKKLTELYPQQLDHFFLEASLLDRGGNSNAAEQALRRAISNNPLNQKAKIALAGYLNTKNEEQRAINLLHTYIAENTDGKNEEMQLLLADLYENEGQVEDARGIYSALQNSNSSRAIKAKTKLALLAFRGGNSESALTILNEILIEDFTNTEALVSRGLVHLYAENTDQAITDFLMALKSEPDSEAALLLAAKTYQLTNLNKQAIAFLEKLLQNNPANKKATLMLAKLLRDENQPEASIPYLERYNRASEDRRNSEQLLIEAYLAAKQWNQARSLAKSIAENTQQTLYTDYIDAYILQLTNNHEQSIQKFASLVDRGVFISQSLRGISNNFRLLDRSQQAVNYLQAYLSRAPSDLFAIELLFQQYQLNNQPQQAENLLTKTLISNPDWTEGHYLMARFYASQQQWQQAIASANSANRGKKYTRSVPMLLLLATSHSALDDNDMAIDYYTRALELAPSLDAIANNLGALLAKFPQDPDKLKRALAITQHFENSNQPLYLDTLGWIYHLNGLSQQGASLLEKAVFSTPTNPVLHYHLGAILANLGEYPGARKHLEESINLGKDEKSFEYYSLARSLLASLPAASK